MRTLEAVLPELGETYEEWKASEAQKNALKEEFFVLADMEVEHRHGLALRMKDYPARDLEHAKQRALLHNPGWMIDEARPHRMTKGLFEIVLRENPSLKPFSHEHDGIKYARTVSKGSVMVDDEWLQEANPELYEGVTFELPWGERVMRPLETLPKELISLLQKYIYNAAPQVRLAAPRPVKKEEE